MVLRLLYGYRDYVMIDDYDGYNALSARARVERLGCGPMRVASSLKHRKYRPKVKRDARISR